MVKVLHRPATRQTPFKTDINYFSKIFIKLKVALFEHNLCIN